MEYKAMEMAPIKKVALVAHDHKKEELLDWARQFRAELRRHELYATGGTGTMLEQELGLKINKLEGGPLGGDQQVGARIAEGKIDFLIFFWDPLEPLSHDPDIKALLRMAVVWNIPLICNRATADFVALSRLMNQYYQRWVPDYSDYHAGGAAQAQIEGNKEGGT